MAGPAFKLVPAGAGGQLPFGFVAQGTSYAFFLPISNPGTTPLVITAVTITTLTGNPGDFVVNNFTGPITIPSGGSNEQLSVSFGPTSAFETFESATLKFTSNATSGNQTFTLTGTCVNKGSTTSYNPTPTSTSTNVSQSGSGSNSNTSPVMSWASQAVGAATPSVTVNLQATGNVSGGPGGGGGISFYYSVDGGTTWIQFYQATYTSVAVNVPAMNVGISPTGLVNLNQLQLRIICQATGPLSGSSVCSGAINSAVATLTVTADVYMQLEQVDAGHNQIPPVVDFGFVQLGNTYQSHALVVLNTSSVTQTVTLTADAANGYSVINQTGSNTIPPGGFISFQLQLIPTQAGGQDDPAALVVTIPGQVGPMQFEAMYGAAILTPAFPIGGPNGPTKEALLIGFWNAQGVVSMMQADPLNLNCEEVCTFVRQYDFQDPDHVKEVSRMLTRYERLGACTLTITLSAISPANQPPVVITLALDATVDGKLRQILGDAQIAGDIVQIAWSRAASAGPFNLAAFTPYIEPRGEDIENT